MVGYSTSWLARAGLQGTMLLALLHAVQSSRTVDYLNSISGDKTVAGIHNRHNQNPNQFTCQAKDVSGHKPGLWSGDFLFEPQDVNARSTMIDEAKAQWESGSLINIMWHACNPKYGDANEDKTCNWQDGKGVQSSLTDSEWRDLLTDGTELKSKWKIMMDGVARHLLVCKIVGWRSCSALFTR
jgi:mannan endo-1,4-beta-mannosidase